MKILIASVFLFFLCAGSALAKISLPALFADSMVIQRGKPVPVWGWADKGECVKVTFRKKSYEAVAGEDGRWQLSLPAQKTGGPYTLTVGDRTFRDVLVGDVWLCSGQSNMDVEVQRVAPQYADTVFNYANPRVRLFRVQNTTNTHGPCHDFPSSGWRSASRGAAWHFSALAYFFAREMAERTGVPQGVVVNSWGGTPIEAWIDGDRMKAHFPTAYSETEMYQDDNLVEALNAAGAKAGDAWQRLLDRADEGLQQRWQQPGTDDSQWRSVHQDGRLYEGNNLSGSLWLRQHITIDKAHAGRPCTLLLGTLYNCDHTYVNGQEVGATYYEFPPRRYKVAAGLLHEGDNVIAVRFVNQSGVPRFYKEKPYRLDFGDGDAIALSPNWLVKTGAEVARPAHAGVSLQSLPSTLYNAVLAPLAPYAVAGAVWYQGESNAGRNQLYAQQLDLLKQSWRERWGDNGLPFVIVQLPFFMQPSDGPQPHSSWAPIREAQRLATTDDGQAELAVTIDLGEAVDIHPLRKREVACRVADAAEHLVFHKKVALSPRPVSASVDNGTVTVTFDQPLRPQNALYEWELAGADGRYVNAQASSNGSAVTVVCPEVPHPVSVRHAWKDNPAKLNTRSQAGLPATPFELKIKN